MSATFDYVIVGAGTAGCVVARRLADSGASVLVAHTDLLAQIAGGVPEGVKVFAVPTPDEIAAAYGVPAEGVASPRAPSPGKSSLRLRRRAPSLRGQRAAA